MALDSIQQAAQEQFARRSKFYGTTHILSDVSDVSAAVGLIVIPKRARVLDVACGAGHTGLFLSSLGHDVVLADLAGPMLDLVQEAASERGLTVETRQHAAEKYPYQDDSFDLVTCRVAPHHFSSPDDFIRETARALRPGGFFLLIDGSVADEDAEAEEWLHIVEKLRDPSHHRFLAPAMWKKLCEWHGLEVQSAELVPFKQPDLEWYFETAATPTDNRVRVRELIASATRAVRAAYNLGEEEGKTVWWWPRLTLIARKPSA